MPLSDPDFLVDGSVGGGGRGIQPGPVVASEIIPNVALGEPEFDGAVDVWAANRIPVAMPRPGEPSGDPALAFLLSFLKAFLVTDANATAAWQATGVAPTLRLIGATHAYNPSDSHDDPGLGFNTRDLPALYLWRESGSEEWLAEDYLVNTSPLKLLWVLPLGGQASAIGRHAFANAFEKGVSVAIERGRTPSWVVEGDPDPLAATDGSLLYTFINAASLQVVSWKRSQVVVAMADGAKSQTYPAVEITLELKELLEPDPEAYDPTWSLGGSIAANTSPPMAFDLAVVPAVGGGAPYVAPAPPVNAPAYPSPDLLLKSYEPSSIASSSGAVSGWSLLGPVTGTFAQGTPSASPSVELDSVTAQTFVRFDTGKTLALPSPAADFLSQGPSTVLIVWRQRLNAANSDHAILDSSNNGATRGYQVKAFDNRSQGEYRSLKARVSDGSTFVVDPPSTAANNYGALKWNIAVFTTTPTRTSFTSDGAPIKLYGGAQSVTLPAGAAGALVLGGGKTDLKVLAAWQGELMQSQIDAAIADLATESLVDIITTIESDGYIITASNFPGLTRLANGDLYYTWRSGPDGNESDNGVLKARRRLHGSKIWGPAVTLYAPAPNVGLSPFSPDVTVLANGDLLMIFFTFAGRMRTMRSTDNGATWGSPVAVTHGHTDYEQCAGGSNGNAIIQDGSTLWMPVYWHETGDPANRSSAGLWKSTDNGLTWPTEIKVADGVADGKQYGEPSLTKINGVGFYGDLAPGNYYFLVREETLATMVEFKSTDGGTTWAKLTATGLPAKSAARVIQYQDGVIAALLRPTNLGDSEIYRRIGAGSWTTHNSSGLVAAGVDPNGLAMEYGTLLEDPENPGDTFIALSSFYFAAPFTHSPAATFFREKWPEWQLFGRMPLILSPAAPTLAPLATQQFTARGAGNYTWSFDSDPSGGSIDAAAGIVHVGATENVVIVVRCTDLNGYSTTVSITVSFYAPTFSSATSVVLAGGSSIITGAHFRNAAPGMTAVVDGVARSVTWNSATSVTITGLPAHAAGNVTGTLTNPDGQSCAITIAYQAVQLPTITSVTPNIAPDAYGSSGVGVTVYYTGSFFTTASNATYGGVSLANLVVDSDTQLHGVTGPGTAGDSLDVTVTNAAGIGTGTGLVHYAPTEGGKLVAIWNATAPTNVTSASGKATAVVDSAGNGNTLVEYSPGLGFDYSASANLINGLRTLHGATGRAMICSTVGGYGDFTVILLERVLASSAGTYYAHWAFGAFTPAGYVHGTHPDLWWSGDNDTSEILAVNDVKTLIWEVTKPVAAARQYSSFINGVAGSQNPKTMSGGGGANTAAGFALVSDSASGPGEGGGCDVGIAFVYSDIPSTANRQIVERILRAEGNHY